MCSIEPELFENDDREHAKTLKMKAFTAQVMDDKFFDSGLTISQERKALVYALMRALAQIRGYLYYRIARNMRFI